MAQDAIKHPSLIISVNSAEVTTPHQHKLSSLKGRTSLKLTITPYNEKTERCIGKKTRFQTQWIYVQWSYARFITLHSHSTDGTPKLALIAYLQRTCQWKSDSSATRPEIPAQWFICVCVLIPTDTTRGRCGAAIVISSIRARFIFYN